MNAQMTKLYRVEEGDNDRHHSDHLGVNAAMRTALAVAGHGGARPSFIPEGERWHAQDLLDAIYMDGYLCLVGKDTTASVSVLDVPKVPKYAFEFFQSVKMDIQGAANGTVPMHVNDFREGFNSYTTVAAKLVAGNVDLLVTTNKGKRYGVLVSAVDGEARTARVTLVSVPDLEPVEGYQVDLTPAPQTPGYMPYLRAMRARGEGPLAPDPLEQPARAPRPITPPRNRWNDEAARLLVGRRIVGAFYMTDADADAFGWYERGLVLKLDDGTELIIFRDDEGNGPGAVAWTDDNGQEGMLPVLGKGD